MLIKSFIRNHIMNKGYHTYTGADFFWYAKHFLKKTYRISTSIDTNESLVTKAGAISQAITRILASGRYTWKRMLVIQNPYNIAPLTAYIIFTTKEPCRVHISMENDTLFDNTTSLSTKHMIPVYGMHANSDNNIIIELIKDGKIIYKKNVIIHTGPLPPSLKNAVSVNRHNAPTASPFTIVFGGSTAFPFAYDEQGEVRYYLKKHTKSYGLYPLSKGHFLLLSDSISEPTAGNPHSVVMYELDIMGRVFKEYLIMNGIHHDGCEKARGGNLLTVSNSNTNHIEDTIIEIDRESGEVVKKLVLGDILYDHPYMDYIDWAHINTVSYQKDDNSILICARNIHSVIKINWRTHKIIWILADPQFWAGTPYEKYILTPAEGTPFFYQAHAAYFVNEPTYKDHKKLIVYDNHWDKRRPVANFDGDTASYVRIYTINEANMTVKIDNSYAVNKSSIRSNGIVIDNRILAMNGHHYPEHNPGPGSVAEFDRITGTMLNEYVMSSSFYRAYPFFADFKDLCLQHKHDKNYCGNLPALEKLSAREISLLTPVNEEYPEELRQVRFRFYSDLLLIHNKDHYVQNVFFVGKKHCYMQNHSQTIQKTNSKFGDSRYELVNQTRDLETDIYKVYIQAENKIYDMKRSFRIQN